VGGSTRFQKLATVCVALTAMMLASAASASAKSLWVSSTGTISSPGKSCVNPGYNSIQAAIQESTPGATIHVCPGTYSEQLTIKHALKLKATSTPGSAKVVLPATVANATTGCETAIEPPYQPDQDEISICTSGVVNITGLAIEAQWPEGKCYDSMYGIFVSEASLVATNDTINGAGAGPINGCQGGVGIEVGTARTTPSETAYATLKGVTVTGYKKNGITVEGTGSTIAVTSSTVTGAGLTPEIAQNGIQISYGATGTVKSSTISGNEYGGGGAESTGLLFYEAGSGGSNVTTSSINENDLGLYYEAETPTNSPELTVSKDEFNANRFAAISLDQGDTQINKDTLNGPGEVGIEINQYEGQAAAPNSSAANDKIKHMDVGVKVWSDKQPGDLPGSFTIKNSLLSENTTEVENESTNFTVVKENDF
jgi:Right handed beta helix region